MNKSTHGRERGNAFHTYCASTNPVAVCNYKAGLSWLVHNFWAIFSYFTWAPWLKTAALTQTNTGTPKCWDECWDTKGLIYYN